MMERMAGNGSKRQVNFGEEFVAEGGLTFFIPIESLRMSASASGRMMRRWLTSVAK